MINRKDLFNKLSKAKGNVNLTDDEIMYIKKNLLNDKMGLKLNFTEKDEKLAMNYMTLEEIPELGINTKDEDKNNLLIEGDNYYALKALEAANVKVDVIYIDPPYNTGQEFVYVDDFGTEKTVGADDPHKHSKWLSFMKRRMIIARELLSDTGVIFISIDDSEQAYLKVLMDEIFGENNFVSSLVRDLGKDGQKTVEHFNQKHDYILVYAYDINQINEFTGIEFNSQSYCKINEHHIERGPYHDKLTLDTSGLSWNKSLDYPLTAPDGTTVYPGPSTLSNDEREKMAMKRLAGEGNIKDWRWRWSERFVEEAIDKKWLEWNKTSNGWQLKQNLYLNKQFNAKTGQEDEVIRTKKSRSILEFTSKQGTNDIKIMGIDFSYPKPVNLVKFLVNQMPDKSSTILDFFAGSGTTGQAVMELNEEDGGNRRFILVTNNEMNGVDTEKEPEKGIARSITRERMYRVIHGKGSKGESIKWEYSKDKKSLKDNSMAYLKVKPIHKVRGQFEELDESVKIFKREFNKNLSIVDLQGQEE